MNTLFPLTSFSPASPAPAPHTAAQSSTSSPLATTKPGLELVCPAGSLPALKAAIDAGADSVYLGFRDATNARNFAGLNFDEVALKCGIAYAHTRGRKVFLALNTYPPASNVSLWLGAIHRAAACNVDALIMADPGLLGYSQKHYPALRRHLSVQASATNHEAINFYHAQFGISRVVLPRVLSLDQIALLAANTPVDLEVFGFGSLCVMVEGRCALSSYVTGSGPNSQGVCSPPHAVRWIETPQGRESRLGGVLIDRYTPDENAGYPTLCKGRFKVNEINSYYALEEPAGLNSLELLAHLAGAGVTAIKIEGRQRSPSYVAQVTEIWRRAIDLYLADQHKYHAQAPWMATLDKLTEGQRHTLGAYQRPWK